MTLNAKAMRTNSGRRGARLLWVLLIALAGPGCDRSAPAPPDSGRVLLIGLDAATFRVVAPLMEEGLLPNLSRIAQAGVHGPLQSFLPLHSPRIWNTIATGKVPEKHGILTFTTQRPDGSSALYLSSDRKTHALWNITSDAGLATAVINWWTTFPPERIDGVMVSDHLFPAEIEKKRRLFNVSGASPTGPTTHPISWEPRAHDLVRDPGSFAGLPNPLASVTPFPGRFGTEWETEVFETDNAVTRIALAVERELHPIVMLVFLSGIDRISHILWGALEPPEAFSESFRPTPEERAAGLAALRGYYVHADRLVGQLLDRYGPEDLVVVVSDHGFEASEASIARASAPIRLTGGHESDAASRGVLFASGPGIDRGATVEGTTVNDVTPTILAWLGLPLGSDMDGKPAAFLERTPPPPIATHDTKPVDRLATESRGAEPELLDRLRALGYID